MSEVVLKPCPFCGHEPDPEDVDTIVPTSFWTPRGYMSHRDIVKRFGESARDLAMAGTDPEFGRCYEVRCHAPCGAGIFGHSRQEAIDKWNHRGVVEYE